MIRTGASRLLITASGLAILFSWSSARAQQIAPLVEPADSSSPASTPQGQQDVSNNDIIVTAQRRRETIQNVPIAISAFSQESLDKQKIEGGPDLLKAIPNVTFSKGNFAGYNLSIRGIGTKAVSVTTDPGVAIDFNSTTLLTNRFFEQEFFDVERVEVLRGPQGTLYGRNATGGVVNIISARPELTAFDGYLKAEVGNFETRRGQAMINVPIIKDVVGIRVAGAYTKRSGFTVNDITSNRVDGRDLYSTRATLSIAPATRFRADLIWEHFSENDNRARTAKQLCHRDDGPASLDDLTNLAPTARGALSQGCKPGSLYDDGAYGVPNGLSLPYVLLAEDGFFGFIGVNPNDGSLNTLLKYGVDPYASTTQTHDLRRISSISDPTYRAKANVFEFNATWDVSDSLQLTSQTAYNTDRYYSTQDYNRFNTVPVFNDGTGLQAFDGSPTPNITPGGYYNDPQLGPSNRLVAQDLVTARTRQFSQELRLSTTGKGPLQLTAGANYTYYRNSTDYYIFINALSAIAQGAGQLLGNNSADPAKCAKFPLTAPLPTGAPGTEGCIYIDPNPLASINGDGHNYFRSSNRFHLNSYGIFADGTYALAPNLKLIAGLRYNDDVKVTTPVPSQLLLSSALALAGTVDRGYPVDPDIRQHFRAVTGRAGLQWAPKTSFTDATMLYATYSRGYKAGGTNPPPIGFAKVNPLDPSLPPFAQTLTYPDRFKPEFVNSFEIGMKNTLFNDRLTLNVTGYYYDFTGYQVSQIIDRSAVNENFNSTMYGLEFEAIFKPTRNFAINANLGLQHTRIKDGARSIDVLDRTQGNPDYLLLKPFPQLPSNCVIKKSVVENIIRANRAIGNEDYGGLLFLCPGSAFSDPSLPADTFPNQGRGFYADLGGNELPNAPALTANIGMEYTIRFGGNWYATPRVDAYHQSQSFARVYNTVADRLHGWENVNLSLRVGNPDTGLQIEAYVKNLFNTSPITDAFINSDDTGLTTNVFTSDPRTIGLNVTKRF